MTNAKTQLLAGLVLFRLLGWPTKDQEIYSCAASRDQASRIFKACRQMILEDEYLSSICKIGDYKKQITNNKTHSVYRALSSEANTAHGLSPSFVVYDELWTARNTELYDAMKTGFGARRSPQFISITTASDSRESLCFKTFQYAKKVKSGEIENDAFLPVLYFAEQDDDPFDEATWKKANPALGDFLSMENFRQLAKEAEELPSKKMAFLQFCLNVTVEGGLKWLPMDEWKHCQTAFQKDLTGQKCYGGLDLSIGQDDLTAFVLVFPDGKGHYDTRCFVWTAKENLRERGKRDGVDYVQWCEEGHLYVNSGNCIDYDLVFEKIRQLGQEYSIEQIGFDDWQGQHIATMLSNAGIEVVSIRQGFKSMSPACKELERLILTHSINFDDHPVMRWCAGNATIKRDDNSNIRPVRAQSIDRIDPIVALNMALNRALVYAGEHESVYNTRGVIAL